MMCLFVKILARAQKKQKWKWNKPSHKIIIDKRNAGRREDGSKSWRKDSQKEKVQQSTCAERTRISIVHAIWRFDDCVHLTGA
jgi:hypothetical protein